MAALAEKEPEIVDESDGDDDVPEDAYDVLESALCGEYGADGHSVNMSQFSRQVAGTTTPPS